MRRVNLTITRWSTSERNWRMRGDSGRWPRLKGPELGHPPSINNIHGSMWLTSSRRLQKVSFRWQLKSRRILITIWRTSNNTHWKKWSNLLQKQEIKILSLSLVICTKGSSLGSSKTWLKVWKKLRMKPLLRDPRIPFSVTWKTFSSPIMISVFAYIPRESLISTFQRLLCLRLSR